MSLRTYVGFVRAVMIGRDGLHRSVLLDLVGAAGGVDPVSYLTTGNVSFRAEPDAVDGVVRELEAGFSAVVGRATPVIPRTLDHLEELVERAPFDEPPHDAPIARLVTMARHELDADIELPIMSPRGGYRAFEVEGGDVFSITIDTGGRVQDPGGLIERTVGVPVTTRAWGTIERIVATSS